MYIDGIPHYMIKSQLRKLSLIQARERLDELERLVIQKGTTANNAIYYERWSNLWGWEIHWCRQDIINLCNHAAFEAPEFKRDVDTVISGATSKPFVNKNMKIETEDEYYARMDLEDQYRSYPDDLIPSSAKLKMNIPGVKKRGKGDTVNKG
jgi:hypothetical protein